MCNIPKLSVYNVASFVNRRTATKISEVRAAKNVKMKINTKYIILILKEKFC